MRTIKFFALFAALLSVISCQKELDQLSATEQETIITCTFASNDDATKTITSDGITPLWEAGDEIMIYDGVSNYQKLTLKSTGDPSSTEGVISGYTAFSFVKPVGWTNVYAIYPYIACTQTFSASVPKINFANQNGTFAKANICVAKMNANTMSFMNVGGILKFSNKPSPVAAIKVPVSELLHDFTVNKETCEIVKSASVYSDVVIDVTGCGVGGDVYIGVPACTIPGGSTFTYYNNLGVKCAERAIGSSTENTIEKNKIYKLGAIKIN